MAVSIITQLSVFLFTENFEFISSPMNLIAQAQSGTGKTATFVLTMLSRVVPSNKWPQCLCLAPTYELAMQIGQVVKKMSEFLPEIEIRYAVKGERSKFLL